MANIRFFPTNLSSLKTADGKWREQTHEYSKEPAEGSLNGVFSARAFTLLLDFNVAF